MADIIKLNAFKKQKARADKEARAEANRAKFGRTKAQKNQAKAIKDKNAHIIDGHKLDNTPPKS